MPPDVGVPPATLGTFRTVLVVIAVVMLAIAVFLKWAIRRLEDGPALSFLTFLARQNRRRVAASAMNLLIPPSALCEGAAIIGLLLFLFAGQRRADLYPLVLAAVLGLLLMFPNETDKDNLIRLDKAVDQSR